jgi:predicted secreted protein
MGATTKIYGVSASFCHKLSIFAETVGSHLRILSENLKILKTHKNSFTGPLRITDLEYGGHDQEIRSFG